MADSEVSGQAAEVRPEETMDTSAPSSLSASQVAVSSSTGPCTLTTEHDAAQGLLTGAVRGPVMDPPSVSAAIDGDIMATSTLGGHSSGNAASASSTPAKTKSAKGTSKAKQEHFMASDISPVTTTAAATVSASPAAQAHTVADSEEGDNPNKVLQAVRSTTLPFPLPVPTYSQAVQAARASGNVLAERATIIRETVKFFLNHKYWWTSEDYDRIAELVVNEFPDLRDPVVWPTTPCYSKVRLDLSMCARNIRRIAKNQEKRRSSPRRSSTEAAEAIPEPPTKQRKSSGKGGRKSSSQAALSGATMVGQMLPHTAHTAHSTVPTTSKASDQKEMAGLPYMLTSSAPTSSPSSTVLPPVAHFLGHPSAHAHSHNAGSIVFPSLLPATLSHTTTNASSTALSTHVAAGGASQQGGDSSMTVTVSGSRHDHFLDASSSLAAAWRPDAQLPDPLPVPPYTEKVMKARKMGVTKYERPLIIRETVLFFLSLKYWWSSVDYDRISDFVVDYFPDLKDPMLSPNMPPNRRVRTDLSQTARNIRRREVMLRRRDSRSPEDRFPAVGTVSMPVHNSQQAHTDFCNELLAAASIIESREDVAKALEMHSGASRETDGKTGVITHTQTAKTTGDGPKTQANSSINCKGMGESGKEHMSEAAKYPYTFSGVSEALDQGLEPSEGVVLNSQLAVVKQEVGEEESRLDQYQALQAQAQASQAWFSAQMTQALSMQALTGLSAQMSQALSVAQISEQLMSSPRSSSALPTTPPAAHQSAAGSSSSASGGNSNGVVSSASLPSVSLSVQQLSQAGYALPSTAPLTDGNLADSSHVDRMSAMAMWRSTCLPDPLPVPPYSLNVLRARDSGNTASARPRIIRETTQFFLAMKMWWTTQDYERIAELVLRQFPALKSVQNVKKDLGTCARNMRRRLPLTRTKQYADYQSPPQGVLNDGEGLGESAGLTLGELANMASLREAQDKGRADTSGLTALTEEQRQALLAHSVYEQNSLAWNALYQQQFSSPAETTSILPHARSSKRSLSDTMSSKGIEAAERELAERELAERELAEALKQTALQQASKHHEEAESARRHSVAVSEGVGAREIKKGSDGKRHRVVSADMSQGEAHPIMKDLISHPALSLREQKVSSDSPATFHVAQVPLLPAVPEGLLHAHQTPVRAHTHPASQVRQEVGNAEEEAPMNLTCSSEISKQHKPQKQVKSEAKASKESSLEAFSAREQVWLPHGSPWKKSGQNVFKALPSPLPTPKYSQKLEKAHEEGLAYRHRSEIIRETARFFLGFKYWWSSADYSRISELVVQLFPELKDPVAHPGQPCYRRVQRDLSMCARNLRRKNTRRQQLSVGEMSSAGSPKKTKSGGTKEKKVKKEVECKETAAAHSSVLGQDGSQQQLEQVVADAGYAHISTSLAQAVFHTAGDHTALPSLTESLLVSGLSSKFVADGSKIGSGVDGVYTASTVTVPHYQPSISAALYATSEPLAPASVRGEHAHINTLDRDQLRLERKHSTKDSSSSDKAAAKKASHASYSHTNHKASSSTVSKSVKSVAPSTHRQQSTSGSQGIDRGLSQPSAGTGRSGGGAKSKEASRHGHLTSSRSGHGDVRTLSNTTAIVTPTLSETHTTDSRNAEGTVSDKVYINPEHGSELQTQLIKLWQEGKFFDASLEVDDYRLPVHKLVLLAASPYLQNTFRHANPTSHLEVNLPRDTGVRAARDFLKYIYQGVLHVAPDTVNALRRIAAMLQIDQLLTYCDDYICRLTSVTTATVSQHSALPHTSPQIPRVSVNLRDPAHSHSLAADQSSLGAASQSLEFADSHGSVSVSGLHYQQGETVASRKRSTPSSTGGQPFHDHCGRDGVEDREMLHGAHAGRQEERQEERQAGVVLAKRMRPSGEQAVMAMVLDSQGSLSYQDVSEEQHLSVTDSQLISLQQSALVQHLTSDRASNRDHTSSVIQRGPNVLTEHMHVLSQPDPTSGALSEHEAAVQFLAEQGEDGQACVELAEENVMVTILPETDMEVEVGEEMLVDSAHTLQHLSGEDGEVVEEVVVDTGDLLQDVEVAACETVECSLLPQTYCSSPEDAHTMPSEADSALQSMASRWAAQQYAEAPLDAATAQQFAAVLQERMYGRSGSPSSHDQQRCVQEGGYDQQGEVYMQPCSDASAVYITTQPQMAGQELVVETSAAADSPQQGPGQDQASLLPQTYCSSPQSRSSPVTSH